jgi:hypothetical protein
MSDRGELPDIKRIARLLYGYSQYVSNRSPTLFFSDKANVPFDRHE